VIVTRQWHLLAVAGLTVVVCACGVLPGASAPTAEPPAAQAVPTVSPTVAKPAAASAVPSPSPAAKPTAPTAAPVVTKPETVYVGITDGQGVFVRKTPVMADRVRAYPDKTALTIVGDDVDGDGQHWKHVKTPDGLEGYVPSIYTVETPP
jgi:hypothetical protein